MRTLLKKLTQACACASVAFCLFSVGTSDVQAQTAGRLSVGGMDLRLFRPAVDSKGFLSVNGTDVLGHTDISFGLIADLGFGFIPYEGFINSSMDLAADAQRRGRLVDYNFTGYIHGNVGLFNSLEIGLQIPISVVGGANITIPGVFNQPQTASQERGLEYQGLGNLIVHGKVRLLRAERNGGLGIAALLQAELPTSDGASRFGGDSAFVLSPQLALEWRPVGRVFRMGLNVGARLMFGGTPTIPVGGRTTPGAANATLPQIERPGSDVTYGPMLTYGLGIGLRLGDSPVELTAETYAATFFGEFGTQGGTSAEFMAGLKIFVERNSYLVLAGGFGYFGLNGLMQADSRGMVGFVFEPSIGDRDGDGYRDDVDLCPDEPEDWDDYSDEDGCPDPDNDRDGILDVDDDCDNTPEDRDGIEDEDGCPEGGEGDRDGDGILDQDDQCPDDPEDRDEFQDEDGCPDPDNDNDGILDVDDGCPNDPEDRDGFQDDDGCPDPDNDADRIMDVDDSCDNDPETYNGVEDEDGCPDQSSVSIEGTRINILEQINFATDSAEILEDSFPLLDQVAATFNGNPNIVFVEIQGHTDERSDDAYNIRLSRDRAASVVEALVQRGVARFRMRSAGYGERCPLDRHSTPQAWDRNRRVEFRIVRTTDGETGVELACPAGRALIPE